jgi:hypothetical protein
MKIKLIIFILMFSSLLVAKTQLSHLNEFNNISKNTSINEFRMNFDKKFADTLEISSEGQTYKIFVLNMLSGIKTELYGNNSSSPGSRWEHSQSFLTTEYYFIFKDNKFFYCGYLYEYLRNANKEIKNIGLSILKINKEAGIE